MIGEKSNIDNRKLDGNKLIANYSEGGAVYTRGMYGCIVGPETFSLLRLLLLLPHLIIFPIRLRKLYTGTIPSQLSFMVLDQF